MMMGIVLTKAAAEHVKTMLNQRGNGLGLRLGTQKDGCNGFSYVVDYADAVEENDQVFESHQVKVIVDDESLKVLDGLKVDFVTENALNKGFEFHNPNVADTCGCGESFSLK